MKFCSSLREFVKHLPLVMLLIAAASVLAAEAASRELPPLIAPDSNHIQLDEIGLYTVGYQYRGQEERFFPDGWSGGFDAITGVALQPAGEQNGKAAMLLHPPWRGGTGVAFQEFRFQLPPVSDVKHIRLVGATGMRNDALAAAGEKPKSDGATFRIFANGQKLLDEHRADSQWKKYSCDLSDLAGQVVTDGDRAVYASLFAR